MTSLLPKIETRDCSQEVLNRLSEKINNTVTQIAKEEDLEISEKRVMSNMEPVMCDPSIMHTIEDVADTLEYKSRVMPSGAAHDAQHIPEIVLGIRSIFCIFRLFQLCGSAA